MYLNTHLFRSFTYHWWQLSLFKVSLISLGVILGSSFAGFFKKKWVSRFFWLGFLIPAIYTAVITYQQVNK